MEDLVTWLRAQVDLDEAHAKKDLWALDRASNGGQWEARYGRNLRHSEIWAGDRLIGQLLHYEGGLPDGAENRHERDALVVARMVRKARERAERVLREVESKRRLLGEYDLAMAERRAHPKDLANVGWWLGTLRMLKLLALPYADRPGYQEEWKP